MCDDCGAVDSSISVLRQENENLRAQLAEKDKDIKRLKSDMRIEENDLVLAELELVSIEMILDGKEVSYLALSFPIVQKVYDLKQLSVAQEKEIAEKDKEIAARKDIDDSLQKKIKRLDQELAPLRERTKGIEEEYSGKIDVTEETRQAVCPQGTSVFVEGKPVLYYNKRNNLKACYIKNLPEQVETVVFVGESFGFYNAELTKETLDNMKDFNTTIDWSSGITMTKASGSEGVKVDYNNLDFGYKSFTITFPKIKLNTETDFYINRAFKCPACGYEAEHSTNAEGEPKNKPFCPECFRKANIPLMKVKFVEQP